MTNIKTFPFTVAEVAEFVDYDPVGGRFTWKKPLSRRTRAGDEAGLVKLVRKDGPRYRYIGFKGVQTPAARLAWLMSYGEWPVTNVRFKDNDTLNCALDNLQLGRFPAVRKLKGGRRLYKMSREAQRHYGLKRYYGMSGEEYGAMLAAQRGVCAICGKPETALLNGAPKAMHVDHDH